MACLELSAAAAFGLFLFQLSSGLREIGATAQESAFGQVEIRELLVEVRGHRFGIKPGSRLGHPAMPGLSAAEAVARRSEAQTPTRFICKIGKFSEECPPFKSMACLELSAAAAFGLFLFQLSSGLREIGATAQESAFGQVEIRELLVEVRGHRFGIKPGFG